MGPVMFRMRQGVRRLGSRWCSAAAALPSKIAGLGLAAGLASMALPVQAMAIPAAAPRLEWASGSAYTNADTLTFGLSFDTDVRNVDPTDFEMLGTTATITSIVMQGVARAPIWPPSQAVTWQT